MHHYLIMLIEKDLFKEALGKDQIQEDLLEAIVETKMEPYNEDLEVEPYRVYPSRQELISMCEAYNIATDRVKRLDFDKDKMPEYGSKEYYEFMEDICQSAELLSIKEKRELAKHFPEWNNSQDGGIDDTGALYRLCRYNKKGRWDWYEIGGRFSGLLWKEKFDTAEDESHLPYNKNTRPTRDLSSVNEAHQPYSLILPDGSLHEQAEFNSHYWESVSDKEWVKKIDDIYKSFPESIAITVDYHS